jgi:histone H3/H4
MNTGKTLFAQIMDFLPWKTFHRIVARHGGDKGVRSLTCAEQFRAMAFAQLTYRESLQQLLQSVINRRNGSALHRKRRQH